MSHTDSGPEGAPTLTIRYRLLHPAARVPTQAHDGDAGWDLYACEAASSWFGRPFSVDTGLSVEIPPGWYGQVVGRSGLAFRHGVIVLAGCIDASYRGTIKVMIACLSDKPLAIQSGDRIAQLVILPVPRVRWEAAGHDGLAGSTRGERGFGSSDAAGEAG